MRVKEITAKSLLRKQRKIDSWFVSLYGMNLYRGCFHNCVYCDGRSERYYVEGDFGHEVTVKINAIDLLKKELNPARKRTPMKRAYVFLGGGVGDAYQAPEEKYELSRRALEVIYQYGFPVHILTKSTLVLRDLDILQKINRQSGVIVSFSFSSVDARLSCQFEPGVPSPEERLAAVRKIKSVGIACGMYLLPVIPMISDTPELLDRAFGRANESGIDFINCGGLTLRPGRQKDFFIEFLKKEYPDLVSDYALMYQDHLWGGADPQSLNALDVVLLQLAQKYKMPLRIPQRLMINRLAENDLVLVILEQIDYYLKLMGRSSPYGFAAHSLSQLKEDIRDVARLQSLRGIGPATERLIRDILNDQKSVYLEKLENFEI